MKWIIFLQKLMQEKVRMPAIRILTFSVMILTRRHSCTPRRGILSAFPGRSYHRSFFFILTLLPYFVYSL